MLILTNEDIQEDIRGFEKRIQDAREKLSKLPQKAVSWKEHKKLDEKKRILNEEINHVKNLISIAEEALTDV
jgi:predicted  nucleic acid-binding Zn-ribbon protein